MGEGGGAEEERQHSAAAAALEAAADGTIPRADRKKAMRGARGIRGRFLNTDAEDEDVLEKCIAAAAAHGVGSTAGDLLGCGTAPCTLPAAIKPVDRVCLFLGAKFPERKKPEVTAMLLMHNPMFAAPAH
jgi:DIS3-like exonuclease 2